jgi:5-methylcytosine-specific restriction protein A
VCARLVHDGTVRCAEHKLGTWVKRPEIKRTTGRKLQRQRAALFSAEPLCRECSKIGRVSEAVIRDHIVPLAEGGTDDDDNVQPLCQSCSDAKSAGERTRGRRRWAGGVPSVPR